MATVDPVKLEPLDFWRLLALQGRVAQHTLAMEKAKAALAQAIVELRDCERVRNEAMTEAGARLGFDPGLSYTFDMQALALVPVR